MNSVRTTVPLSDFHTFVRPLVGDVPDLLVDHALQEAIKWFCSESRVLVDQTTVYFQENVRDYELMIPEHQFLLAPDFTRWRRYGGRHANPADFFFQDIFGCGRSDFGIHRDGPHPVLEFAYSPRQEGEKVIDYSWSVKPDFCEVPLEIYNQWITPVKYRAAMELFQVPGEIWSSQNKATQYRVLSLSALEEARRRKAKNYTYGVSKMRAKPFVRGGLYSRMSYRGVG